MQIDSLEGMSSSVHVCTVSPLTGTMLGQPTVIGSLFQCGAQSLSDLFMSHCGIVVALKYAVNSTLTAPYSKDLTYLPLSLLAPVV